MWTKPTSKNSRVGENEGSVVSMSFTERVMGNECMADFIMQVKSQSLSFAECNKPVVNIAVSDSSEGKL